MRQIFIILAVLLLLPPAMSVQAVAPPELAAPASDAAWARALVSALPRATAVNDADGNKIFDSLDGMLRADALARIPVIVSFRQDVTTGDGLAATRAVAPDAPVSRAFHIIPAYAGMVRLDEALRIAALPSVRQLEYDHPGEKELDTATLFMGADAVVDQMGVTGSLDGDVMNFTAQDINIAVLDTGFHAAHQDLAGGKIVHFLDLGDDKTEAYDEDGHGTHVASIAAGLGAADAKYRGVAPGAGIVGLRIVGTNAQGASTALAGYEWLVANKDTYNVRVTTMSFGFGIATDGTSALERGIDAAWDAGLVNFKSNGNSGPERGTMTVPAAARGILGVAAMRDPGSDGKTSAAPVLSDAFGFNLASFSSRGPTTDGRVKPDLAAPGVAIMAAQSGTTDKYVSLSGTSMASPFAAGSAALVIAANPALTPDDVRDIMKSTAEDWGLSGQDVDYGAGRIQVHAAVAESLRRANAPVPAFEAPVVPFHEVRAGIVANGPYEGTFDITDVSSPLAATFIAEGKLVSVRITSPGGAPVGVLDAGAPARQRIVAFTPTTPGTYTFQVTAPAGTAFVVDLSHGVASTLLDPIASVDGAESIVPAAVEDARIPLGGLVGIVGLAVAVFMRRR